MVLGGFGLNTWQRDHSSPPIDDDAVATVPDANTGRAGEQTGSSVPIVEEFLVLASRNNALFQPVENLAPLRTGDYLRFSIRLRQAAYVRLVWIDASGEPQELYPLDPEAGQQEDRPVRAVHSPLQLDRGWPLEGNGGIETALLLVNCEPLHHLEPDAFRTGLPAGASLKTVRRFVAARTQTASAYNSAEDDRSLGTTTRQVDNAVLQLLERMRQHADIVQAVTIPHDGQ